MIVLRTCPEEMRLKVVEECISGKHQRPDPANEDEVQAAHGLHVLSDVICFVQ